MGYIEGARKRTLHSDGTPANGDFNGDADTGDLVVDTATGQLYVNTGTLEATTWTLVGSQA